MSPNATETYSELVIGAGQRPQKLLFVGERSEFSQLTTLDLNPDHDPDVVWDLTQLPLPFEDGSFDEIHAYEVLEHTGLQGDYEFFFAQFSDFHRILKPGGLLIGTSPTLTSPWLWGDPGHTRAISRECFTFLNQQSYADQVGKTPLTDYRFVYKADFELVYDEVVQNTFCFMLKAITPSRVDP